MRFNKIIALAIACGISATAYAADTFDMGNVQVVGKDAQTGAISQSANNLEFGMTDKSIPMPELTPEIESLEYQPMTEKPVIENIHRENKNEFSAALGVGNRSSSEVYVNGKTQQDNYDADLIIFHHKKDGFKSTVDTKQTGIKARITSFDNDTTTVHGGVEILDSKGALRGTKASINNGTDANAKINDDNKRIWINGDKTLDNGAFLKGYAKFDMLERETSNDVHFKDEQDLKSFRVGATYKNRIDDKTKANATLDIRKEDLDSDCGNDISFTKTVAAFGATRELSPKTEGSFGIKAMKLKHEDRLSPYANVSYKPDELWKISLGYEEDLGNDNLERLFLPRNRYVDTKAFDFDASVKKTLKASVDYRTHNGDLLGVDLFTQKEDKSLEFVDIDNFDGRRILSSRPMYADAKRKGMTFRGDFAFEEGFTLTIRATAQDPKDSDGNRLSYEAKQILDVGLNYKNDKWMFDFTRRAESGRKAYAAVNGEPYGLHSLSDYTRSDLAVRYKFNERFTGYIKVKDLYDEAKKVRKDVEEEGRVTLGGLEFHF